jgi:hypothetical protein
MPVGTAARRNGLVVIHVDGLSHRLLHTAVEQGHMPFVRRLIDEEGYRPLPYGCGLPSTTPFAQAGILYGDNAEIPSYRWWDKAAGFLVGFGSGSTFPRVAEHYFAGREPLTRDGACIAALYRAGSTDRFGPAYVERHRHDEPDPSKRAIVTFLANPVTLYFWLRHGGASLFRIAAQYTRARANHRPTAEAYVLAHVYHEVLVHHLTRFALRQAMDEGVPTIYACFYTYDETAHAFGPDDPGSLRILRHVDHSIRFAAEKRRNNRAGIDYEMVILSDHGQVPTRPFAAKNGRRLGRSLADWLPGHQVIEYRGPTFGPPAERASGHVAVTYSGGLAHVYFTDIRRRLDRAELDTQFPGLIDNVANLNGIGIVMVKDGEAGTICTASGRLPLGLPLERETRKLLAGFDEPEVLAHQLRKLNSFQRSGDLVVFGAYDGTTQVNFEDQVGGHGSLGGDQLHPFLLLPKRWEVDTSGLRDASDVHPLLVRIRDRDFS